MTPKSYWRKKPIISMIETHIFLGKFTIFGAFMKGGTPLATLQEFHFMWWNPPFHVMGVPLYRMEPYAQLWGSTIGY
jgi:hypothetical protein